MQTKVECIPIVRNVSCHCSKVELREVPKPPRSFLWGLKKETCQIQRKNRPQNMNEKKAANSYHFHPMQTPKGMERSYIFHPVQTSRVTGRRWHKHLKMSWLSSVRRLNKNANKRKVIPRRYVKTISSTNQKNYCSHCQIGEHWEGKVGPKKT